MEKLVLSHVAPQPAPLAGKSPVEGKQDMVGRGEVDMVGGRRRWEARKAGIHQEIWKASGERTWGEGGGNVAVGSGCWRRGR